LRAQTKSSARKFSAVTLAKIRSSLFARVLLGLFMEQNKNKPRHDLTNPGVNFPSPQRGRNNMAPKLSAFVQVLLATFAAAQPPSGGGGGGGGPPPDGGSGGGGGFSLTETTQNCKAGLVKCCTDGSEPEDGMCGMMAADCFYTCGTCTTKPCAAPLLNDVGYTTVSGKSYEGTSFSAGENICKSPRSAPPHQPPFFCHPSIIIPRSPNAPNLCPPKKKSDGPFEAGFDGSGMQANIISSLGCSDAATKGAR
jgi:hypothetical protein